MYKFFFSLYSLLSFGGTQMDANAYIAQGAAGVCASVRLHRDLLFFF
jgi:hypothetical protein